MVVYRVKSLFASLTSLVKVPVQVLATPLPTLLPANDAPEKQQKMA